MDNNNNEIENLFENNESDIKVKTPINQHTDISKTTDIRDSEVFDPNKVEELDVDEQPKESVINKQNSFQRNRFADNSVSGVKIFDSKPVKTFKFNFKIFATIIVLLGVYLIVVPNFLGKYYDKYIFKFFMQTLDKSLAEKTPDVIIPLFGLFVPILTVLFFYISIIGFEIVNFITCGDKQEFMKDFVYKSLIYSALIAIVLVTLYRFANIDLIVPIIKILTIGGYKVPLFNGI